MTGGDNPEPGGRLRVVDHKPRPYRPHRHFMSDPDTCPTCNPPARHGN